MKNKIIKILKNVFLRMFRQMKRFPILNRIRFNSAQSTGSTEPTFGQLYFNYVKSNCLLFRCVAFYV